MAEAIFIGEQDVTHLEPYKVGLALVNVQPGREASARIASALIRERGEGHYLSSLMWVLQLGGNSDHTHTARPSALGFATLMNPLRLEAALRSHLPDRSALSGALAQDLRASLFDLGATLGLEMAVLIPQGDADHESFYRYIAFTCVHDEEGDAASVLGPRFADLLRAGLEPLPLALQMLDLAREHEMTVDSLETFFTLDHPGLKAALTEAVMRTGPLDATPRMQAVVDRFEARGLLQAVAPLMAMSAP